MATLVALGPGHPDLIPLASWRVIEAAGPVSTPADEPLREWLGSKGIALADDSPVVAASGAAAAAAAGPIIRGMRQSLGATLSQRCSCATRWWVAAVDRAPAPATVPGDREQTVATIVPHTIEEAYETAEAAAHGPGPKLIDELGDLLFQSFFGTAVAPRPAPATWRTSPRGSPSS